LRELFFPAFAIFVQCPQIDCYQNSIEELVFLPRADNAKPRLMRGDMV
jgi:hypothetical protein